MKRTTSLFFVFAVCVLFAVSAFATASTHIWGPSTDVQGFNVWHVTADCYQPVQLDKTTNGIGTRLPPVTNLGLTVGILPYQKFQMEVGFDHKAGYGTFDTYPLYFNLKIGTPEDAFGKGFPAIAVGAFDLGTKKDMTNYNVLYGKVAKTLPVVGRISAGYFSGNDTLLLDDKGKKSNTGLMVAWERTMPEISDKLWLCVEYMGSQSAYGTMNVGFSWKCSDNVSLLLGYDIFNNKNLTGVENSITIQTDIDLPGFGSK
jgi:hypothetical protein